jgi:hypothetical protein
MEMKKRNTSKTLFSNPMDYNWKRPAIPGQAPEDTFQVIPAGEPESRAKTILFFLCLIL